MLPHCFAGADRFYDVLEMMTDKRPSPLMKICWKYIAPLILNVSKNILTSKRIGVPVQGIRQIGITHVAKHDKIVRIRKVRIREVPSYQSFIQYHRIYGLTTSHLQIKGIFLKSPCLVYANFRKCFGDFGKPVLSSYVQSIYLLENGHMTVCILTL